MARPGQLKSCGPLLQRLAHDLGRRLKPIFIEHTQPSVNHNIKIDLAHGTIGDDFERCRSALFAIRVIAFRNLVVQALPVT